MSHSEKVSPFTKIGSFYYWNDLLNASETSEHFEQMVSELRAKKQGYGAWMAGRRVGEYAAFAGLQKEQIHGHALTANDEPVCSCGLVAESEVEDLPDGIEPLFANPGHIDSASREVVTSFYIRRKSEDGQTWPFPLHFFCQICFAREPADATGDPGLDATLLEDFRVAHKHGHENENAGR